MLPGVQGGISWKCLGLAKEKTALLCSTEVHTRVAQDIVAGIRADA